MDPLRWQRLEQALDELLDLSAADRPARLDALAGDDPAFRAELERLLAADAATRRGILDDGLDSLADAILDAPVATTPAGRRIGPYRVLGLLGRGGMGEVLLAERADGEYEQRVALKLLPAERLGEDNARRLRHERQILARLRHPNIATLHDGGVTEDGAPYFAMELVEGEPITDYCDAQRLDVEARLALFDTVCRAVRYAHRNLVVHRDIKPGNVLVTADGVVKLLDFGIAKLLGDAESTVAEQRFLTPGFAAPEQLRGEPTNIAADVYALGVLLYELLCGKRPHGRRTDPAAMLRAVLEDTPLPPSRAVEDDDPAAAARSCAPAALRRRLQGDLDTIVARALEKDPAERYPSSEALRLDLERHLASEPVSARPASRAYRLRKFVKRHRLAVTLTSLIVLAILTGAVWIGLLYARAERNLGRALAAESASAREAETLRRVTGFLSELFEEASPEVSHGRDVTARELLDAGAARIERELKGAPDVRSSLQLTMSTSYRWLGRYDDALRMIESAVESRLDRFGPESPEYAEALTELAGLRSDRGELDEAEAAAREAIRIFAAARGPRSVSVAEPTSVLGATLIQQGRFPEAEVAMGTVLEIHEANPRPEPEWIASASNDLGAALSQMGRLDEAAVLFTRAVETHRAAGDSTHPSLSTYLTNLGDVRMRQGRLDEAESLMTRGLAVAEAAFDSSNVDLAERHNALGQLYDRLGRFDEAESQFLRSVAIWRANVDAEHPRVIWVLDNLVGAYTDAGRLAKADSLSDVVVAMSERQLGLESVYHGAILRTRADLRDVQGRHADAAALREQALGIYATAFGDSSPIVARRMVELARDRALIGETSTAAALYRSAIAVFELPENADDARGQAQLPTLRAAVDSLGAAR